MGRREVFSHVVCAEEGCKERASFVYDTQRDRARGEQDRRRDPWRCTRHMRPDELLTVSNRELTQTLIATRLPHLPDDLFWTPEGGVTGSGFTHGPGFKAFAEDFPEGTRLVVVAHVSTPVSTEPEPPR